MAGIKELTDLLAETGMLLNAIRARDGVPYHSTKYQQFHTEYCDEKYFYDLIERIRDALGGDILTAYWNISKKETPHAE
jgi:hypothetical protein